MESNTDFKKKFTADELNDLREWIDCIPLSRPKKNLARDFADGVLVAEILAHFFPAKVNVKSFFMAHSKKNKAINWNHLNDKIFPQFGIRKFKESTLNKLMDAKPGLIEKVIYEIRGKMSEKIPAIAVKSKYKSNTVIASKKKERPKRSRMPMYSKIEIQLENEARAAAKSGLGDCCSIASSGMNPICQISVGATTVAEIQPQIYNIPCVTETEPQVCNGSFVAEIEPQMCNVGPFVLKAELGNVISCENDVNYENVPEKTLQAFDSSWFSYPICNDPILQVNDVDTTGLV